MESNLSDLSNLSIFSDEAIFTTQPGSEQYGLNELMSLNVNVKLLEWMDRGVGRIQTAGGFDILAEKFREKPPVFIRHICPAHKSIALKNSAEDVDALVGEAIKFISLMDTSKTFSVQTRFLGKDKKTYNKYTVNQQIADQLSAAQFSLDINHPSQVISVVCMPNTAYIGVSAACDNLSDWGGGAHRFARNDEQISRAEFKLLEAVDVFNLKMQEGGTALDLGAAPGGWTQVLRSLGLNVVAVDPAKLHPAVAADAGVTHFRKTAQEYFESAGLFDVVVNDMRMDARLSAQIMGTAANHLKPDGLAIMTLKLPDKGIQKITAQTIQMLQKWYVVAGARQLFHNRSEVTVVLKLKQDLTE